MNLAEIPPFGGFGLCNLAEIPPEPSRPKATKFDVRVEGEIFTRRAPFPNGKRCQGRARATKPPKHLRAPALRRAPRSEGRGGSGSRARDSIICTARESSLSQNRGCRGSRVVDPGEAHSSGDFAGRTHRPSPTRVGSSSPACCGLRAPGGSARREAPTNVRGSSGRQRLTRRSATPDLRAFLEPPFRAPPFRAPPFRAPPFPAPPSHPRSADLRELPDSPSARKHDGKHPSEPMEELGVGTRCRTGVGPRVPRPRGRRSGCVRSSHVAIVCCHSPGLRRPAARTTHLVLRISTSERDYRTHP